MKGGVQGEAERKTERGMCPKLRMGSICQNKPQRQRQIERENNLPERERKNYLPEREREREGERERKRERDCVRLLSTNFASYQSADINVTRSI